MKRLLILLLLLATLLVPAVGRALTLEEGLKITYDWYVEHGWLPRR